VAVDETVRNPTGDSRDVKQPLPLPKGVSNLAVGVTVSSVPEPGLWGLLGLLMATFFWRRRLNR
jgi:Ca-activated chloride channel family protein